ncbi:MAG: hypothetical protein ACREPN_03595 [Rudaea sp.]
MDLYLPADYLRLREELPDWRDAPAVCVTLPLAPETAHATTDSGDSADPLWQPL